MAVPGANALPAAGATVGSVIGGTGGTLAEPGGGSALGAVGGAGVGGMAGEAGKQLLNTMLYGQRGAPPTPQAALSDISKQGAGQAAVQGLAELLPFLAGPLKNAAVSQYERALSPTTKANKYITQQVAPELIQRGEYGSLGAMEDRASQNAESLRPQLNQAYEELTAQTARKPVRGLLPAGTTEIPLGEKPVPPEMPGQLNEASQMPRRNVVSGQPSEQLQQQLGPTAGTIPARIYRPMYSTATPELPETEAFSGPGVMQTRDPRVANQINPPSGSYPNLPSSYIPGSGKEIISDLENLKSTYQVEGKDANNAAVNAISGVQDVVRQYGNDISPNSLRKLKQIFDDPVAQRGGYSGTDLGTAYTAQAQKAAADSIRSILHQASPNLAALDRETHFWLQVQQVTSQSGLRKTGQEGGLVRALGLPFLSGIGGMTGMQLGHGAEGAGVGALTAVATMIVRSPAWRTASAVAKDRLADALARGDVGAVSALATRFGVAGLQSYQNNAQRGQQRASQQK